MIASMRRMMEIKVKYTAVTQSSCQRLIKIIQDVEHKASDIKRKRNFATQNYSAKNKGKVKTPEQKRKYKKQ